MLHCDRHVVHKSSAYRPLRHETNRTVDACLVRTLCYASCMHSSHKLQQGCSVATALDHTQSGLPRSRPCYSRSSVTFPSIGRTNRLSPESRGSASHPRLCLHILAAVWCCTSRPASAGGPSAEPIAGDGGQEPGIARQVLHARGVGRRRLGLEAAQPEAVLHLMPLRKQQMQATHVVKALDHDR